MKSKITSPIATIAASIVALSIFGSCEKNPTEVEKYQPQAVLSAYLCLDEPVEKVFLERVSSIYGYYTPRGIDDAVIKIYRLNEDSTKVDSFNFRQEAPGSCVYRWTGRYLYPSARRLYRIDALTPQGEHLWAITRVPGAINPRAGSVEFYQVYPDSVHIVRWVSELKNSRDSARVEALDRNMPNLMVRWPDVDSAAGFEGVATALADTLFSLDPGTEFDPNEPVDTTDQNQMRVGWDFYREGQRGVDLGWILFNWEGYYRLELRALSPSYADYLFSLFRVEQGLINQPTTNINGGLGIFGALSRYRTHIYMRRAEE
ncbi:MAG: DUF4249 family protein [Calditrichota bacterium]